jgi:hypothetical protein
MPRRMTLDPKMADSDELVRTTIEAKWRHYYRIVRWCRENNLSIADVLDALMQLATKDEKALQAAIEETRRKKVIERAQKKALNQFAGMDEADFAFVEAILKVKGRKARR